MDNNVPTQIVNLTARALELVGVAVIAVGFIYSGARALAHFSQKKPTPFETMKVSIGKSLQLGLELLVAADIISTVTVEPTREKIISLGLLIVVRTFLSWSIAVEIEGCWPWQVASKRKD